MPCAVASDAKGVVLKAIRSKNPRPTELLQLLGPSLSYREIQDAVGALLESDEVELDKDRRLRPKVTKAS